MISHNTTKRLRIIIPTQDPHNGTNRETRGGGGGDEQEKGG